MLMAEIPNNHLGYIYIYTYNTLEVNGINYQMSTGERRISEPSTVGIGIPFKWAQN